MFTRNALLFAACLSAATGISAQTPPSRTLIFTTMQKELTWSTMPPPSLQRISPEDVNVVTPAVQGFTAEKFVPHKAFATMMGDEDNDTNYWEPSLAGQIDAVHARRYPTATGPDAREIYISVRQPIGSAVSGATASHGDVFRVEKNGQFKFLIRESQIRSALGIHPSRPCNVDAVSFDHKFVYVSLEDDEKVHIKLNGTGPLTWQLARDGAILAIPCGGFGEPVPGVLPNSGIFVLREAEVDAMCVNSGINDSTGNDVKYIKDTDGICIDPDGGYFKSTTGGWRNMLFCGEGLSGCGILSTQWNSPMFGKIAELNNTPMGFAAGQTIGWQVGLRATATGVPLTLNGLEVVSRVNNFATETPQPVLTGGSGTLQVDIGGAPSGGFSWLLIGLAPALPPATAAPSFSFFNPAFPDLYPFLINVPVAISPQGYGSWTLPISYGSGGGALTFQVANFTPGSGFSLSTPLTLEAK